MVLAIAFSQNWARFIVFRIGIFNEKNHWGSQMYYVDTNPWRWKFEFRKYFTPLCRNYTEREREKNFHNRHLQWLCQAEKHVVYVSEMNSHQQKELYVTQWGQSFYEIKLFKYLRLYKAYTFLILKSERFGKYIFESRDIEISGTRNKATISKSISPYCVYATLLCSHKTIKKIYWRRMTLLDWFSESSLSKCSFVINP